MSGSTTVYQLVRDAWASIPAPPPEDMEAMDGQWTVESERLFVGVAPVDVDTDAPGFDTANPLFDLPPNAAAAYLGTFLLALLKGFEFQSRVGIFTDVLSRAHTITCLTLPEFREQVVRPFLSNRCREALSETVKYLASHHGKLGLSDEQVSIMLALDASR